MWGISSLALDICSLCQMLDERASSSSRSSSSTKASAKCVKKHQLELDTDTIVIGNGPAGIALSAMLSGMQPFYNRQSPHPDPILHERLLASSSRDSLFSQDLASLAELYHSQSELVNPSQTPFAVLYDSLVRPHATSPPSADLATAPTKRPSSCLCWKRNFSTAVPHIVLGDQNIGGSWTGYDDDMVTVSMSEWMDLPGYSTADFMGDPAIAQMRPRAALYKHYLLAYVLMMECERNFRPYTKVTQLEKFCHPSTGEQYWEVRGVEKMSTMEQQRDFVLRCRNVVLACGQQQPKILGVSGELSSGRIVYNLSGLKQRLEDGEEADSVRAARADCPVMVVGDGISAADAVLHCLVNEQPVLHVIRRTERELRNIQLSHLSPVVYPEYAQIYQLMTGRTREVNYRRVLGTSVSAIEGNLAVLDTPQGSVREPFHTLAVCIGRRSELPLLKEHLHDDGAFEFTTHYQSINDPTLFAVGAMAGDHFVRYLVGGALCVAQTLTHKYHARQRNRAVPVAQPPRRRELVDEGRKNSKSGGGGCTVLRSGSAGPLAAALAHAAALATAAQTGVSRPNNKERGISRAKSQMQLTTAAVV